MQPPRLVTNRFHAPTRVGPTTQLPARFHQSLPGYRPTALVEAPHAARRLGVKHVHVKDESDRFDMPSFKVGAGARVGDI